MLYTAQQLQGGQRYNPKVLLGNWSEDVDLDQEHLKNFLKKRDTGDLLVHQVERKLSTSLTTVDLSYSHDNLLHFGSRVMLLSQRINGYLVCDTGNRISGQQTAFAVTSSDQIRSPVARSVFEIQRCNQNDGFEGDALHYGQPFYLIVHPYLSPNTLFLQSQRTSTQSFARFSRNQEVCVTARRNADVIWKIEHLNPGVRFESHGDLVQANSPVIIKHNQTGNFLASDFLEYKNDFGVEYEVCCKAFLNNAKTQQLGGEKVGKYTTDNPSRPQSDHNTWVLRTAEDPSMANVTPPEQRAQTPQQILEDIRSVLSARGSYGIRGLARVFRSMDDNGNRRLDLADFQNGLLDYGIFLSDQQAQTLLNYFDRNKDGQINFDEFLVTIKGPLNQRRRELVRLAHQKLDKNRDGQITLDEIAITYDATKHPEVLSGNKTEEEIFKEFISMWDTQNPDGIVTFEEFVTYYEDVSASIDSDDYFEVMIRNAWKI